MILTPEQIAELRLIAESGGPFYLDGLLDSHEELRASFDQLHAEWGYGHDRGDHLVYRAEWEAFDAWQRGQDALRAHAEALAAFAWHDIPVCPAVHVENRGECTCGYEDALAAYRAAYPKETDD